MKLRTSAAVIMALAMSGAACAADSFKVGLMTTLSGPGATVGVEIRDGFELGVKHLGGKIGGVDTKVLVVDDQQKADIGRQALNRLLKRDRVDVMTGMAFSNVLLPLMPSILSSDTPYISANTGPADYAGAKCDKNFFVVSWQNEDIPAAMGKYVSEQGHKKVFLIAPNYPGGRESIAGFKHLYEGELADEVYVKVGQLDFAAEIAQVRASKADSVFFFLPGGMGISFIKQLHASGLSKDVAVYTPGFSADQDTIRAVGDAMLGMTNSSQWSPDIKNDSNERFVSEFEKEYGRIPSLYASQAYDAALLLDSAVRSVGGDVKDRDAFRAALRDADFNSVRGDFIFNTNQYPIQDYYMRVVEKDDQGRITNRIVGKVLENYRDPFAVECKMG